ncbi:MAG: hypothetical protein JWN25_1826 [Verrucomicrobiales bacterium]|jgi:hypothetical protein|nr:hypothetical protein [Verrucomicrobiales bacterium]
MYRITALWVSALLIVLLIILFSAFLAPFAKVHLKHYQKMPHTGGLPWQTNLALVCRGMLTNDHPIMVYTNGDLRLPSAIRALTPVAVHVNTNSVTLLMEKGMHTWSYLLRPGTVPDDYVLLKQTPHGDESLVSIH